MEGSEKQKEENLPPGFRFHPSDEELITCYLTNKISDANFISRAIADVNLNKCEPWDLPGKSKMGEKEWYFFSHRDRKYPTGVRTNRATNTGYWKTTGKDKEIFNSVTSELIGMKKTLVFYRGRAPRGEKTNWVMHEYRIHSRSVYRSAKDEWVVCRVFQKTAGVKKFSINRPRSMNLEISPSSVPSPVIQLIDPVQFPFGRNSMMTSAELPTIELSRSLRGDTASGSLPDIAQSHHQLNYPNMGAFGFSGLNLNLGGSMAADQQHVLRPLQSTAAIIPQDLGSSSMLSMENGYGSVNLNNANGGNSRFVNMEQQCVEFDTYWPSYFRVA
ncbi:hypothetical protein Dimus_010775 [Dionaea muscipula]